MQVRMQAVKLVIKRGMTMPNFTDAQQQAIHDRHQRTLVSASAGSGKTTVLVQRVIELVESGENIDSLLVVTFTDAAAKNMRDRIRQALLKAAADPKRSRADRERMREQVNRLAVAHISTIHAFCRQLISQYYYRLKLDPASRLLTDDTEQELLRETVWDQVREYYYQRDADHRSDDEQYGPFEQLVVNFGGDRNDDGLGEAVHQLDTVASAQAQPAEWLKKLPQIYQFDDGDITNSHFYRELVKPLLKRHLHQWLKDMHELTLSARDAGLALETTFTADSETLAELNDFVDDEQISWDELAAKFTGVKFTRAARTPKKGDPDRDLHQRLIKRRNTLKKAVQRLASEIFTYDSQQLKAICGHCRDLVSNLAAVTIRFEHDYQTTKRRRHLMDFNDLEHYAYQLLTPAPDDEAGQSLVQDLRQSFTEILIDEYQDTNQLQEAILTALAGDGSDSANPRMFMVGDVKQSIYRFREADPTLFLTKYHDYQQTDDGQAIVLGENFRSTRGVTGLVNVLFEQLMDTTVGEMDYDQAAHLKAAADYYPENTPQKTELLLYDANAGDGDVQEADKLDGELRMVATRIRQMVTNHEQVYDPDSGQFRDVTYGDIVILERTHGINNQLIEQFGAQGVPVTVHDVNNYFASTEVRVMINELRLIDNPYQDIPLAAVLRSPIVGLNENQLAYLRINDRTDQYYQALVNFRDHYDPHQSADWMTSTDREGHQRDLADLYRRVDRFLTQLQTFRQSAQQLSLVDLIWQIYTTTGYLDYVGGMPGGAQRQANLHALYQRAQTYEENGFKGLYRFVRFIERIREENSDIGSAPVQLAANTVNVMTIHGSKGLEFPIVFLVDADHGFNNQSLRSNVVVDPHVGVGIQYVDSNNVRFDTPQRAVIKESLQRSQRAEDLRLLYVALTRAQQRLIITGSFNEATSRHQLVKTVDNWQRAYQNDGALLGAQLRTDANSFLDWIGMALMRYPYFDLQKLTVTRQENGQDQVVSEVKPSVLNLGQSYSWQDPNTHFQLRLSTWNQTSQAINQLPMPPVADHHQQSGAIHPDAAQQKISHLLNFRYPYQAATATTAYQSVTAVKRVFEDPDERQMTQLDFAAARKAKTRGLYLNRDFATPQFMQTTDVKPTAAEIGTATHLVFQWLDLHSPVDAEKVNATIDALVHRNLISKTIAKQINRQGIINFYQTAVGQEVLAHPDQVHREVPFSLLMNGGELFSAIDQSDGEHILIHGIIDGYLELNDGIILFDYKTDHVDQNRQRAVQAIVDRYRGQLVLYRRALNLMESVPVKEMLLYLVDLGQTVPVSRREDNLDGNN